MCKLSLTSAPPKSDPSPSLSMSPRFAGTLFPEQALQFPAFVRCWHSFSIPISASWEYVQPGCISSPKPFSVLPPDCVFPYNPDLLPFMHRLWALSSPEPCGWKFRLLQHTQPVLILVSLLLLWLWGAVGSPWALYLCLKWEHPRLRVVWRLA